MNINRKYNLLLIIPFAFISGGCASHSVPDDVAAPSISIQQSPLDEWLVYGVTVTEEESRRQAEADELRVDEAIAKCMQEQGFQYLPRVRDADWNSNNDPRQVEYLDSLSDAELEAWWEAFWGPDFEQDADGNYIWSFERAGCGGQAQYLFEQETNWQQEFRPLFEALDQFYANLMVNPEFVALDSEWSYCMADAGHPNLIRPETIQTAENAITNQDHANLNCQIETDYENRIRDIVFSAERQFISDHRTDLEAFRAAAEQRN